MRPNKVSMENEKRIVLSKANSLPALNSPANIRSSGLDMISPVTKVSHKSVGKSGAAKKKKTGSLGETMDVVACQGCKITITEDVKALQCDRCKASSAWKCIKCVGISRSTYETLIIDAESETSLKWFCDECNSTIMNVDEKTIDSQKIDAVLKLLGQLMDEAGRTSVKLEAIQNSVDQKADTKWVSYLETRIKDIEDKLDGLNGHVCIETTERTKNSSNESLAAKESIDQQIDEGTGQKKE